MKLNSKARLYLDKAIIYILACILVLISCFPVYWMVVTSIRPFKEIYGLIRLIPQSLTLENYILILNKDFFIQLKNSLLIAVGTVALNVTISLLGGYAIARINFLGRKILVRSILTTYVLPYTLLVIPFFFIVLGLRLYNTLFSVIFACVTFTLPFTVWTLASYLQSIPKELEDSAMIDGCGRIGVLFKIVLPLAAPGIVAIAMYAFVFAWNEYLYVIALVGSRKNFTLPLGIASLLTSDIIPWGKMMAMSVLYAIPGIVFFTIIQKYVAQGLAKGAVKG